MIFGGGGGGIQFLWNVLQRPGGGSGVEVPGSLTIGEVSCSLLAALKFKITCQKEGLQFSWIHSKPWWDPEPHTK